MNYIEHNKQILKKYTGNRSKELKIAIMKDDKPSKVFKNRYQAAKWMLEQGLSNYWHPRGKGFTTACLAGSLTNLITQNTTVYGQVWKLLSPNDTVTKITEPVQRDMNHIRTINHNPKHPKWLVIGKGIKPKLYCSLKEISHEFNVPEKTLSMYKIVNDYSIIPYRKFPIDKQFNSYTKAAKFLRTEIPTIKKAILNNSTIHNYRIIISEDSIKNNYNRIKSINDKK